MTDAASPLLSRLTGPISRSPRLLDWLRLLGLFLLSGVLMAATHVACGGGPAGLLGGLAVVAGFGVAGHARDGLPALLAALMAAWLGLILVGIPGEQALAMGSASGLAMCGLAALLRHVSFDWRLERRHDLACLLGAALLFATAMALAWPWLVHSFGGEGSDGGDAASFGRAWLAGSGFLLTALPLCTVALPAASIQRQRVRAAGIAVLFAATVATSALPWASGGGGLGFGAWFLPFVALLALAAMAGSGGASLALLLMGVAAGVAAHRHEQADPVQALWLVSSLQSLLLIAHAMRADAASRVQRWEWALDGTRLGVADWRLGGEDSFVSAAWRSLVAFDASRWTPEAWLASVHPEDQGDLRQALAQVSSGDTGRIRLELRMPVSDTWRWLEATLLVIERAPDGRPVRLLATLLDVDERHDAQERQRLSVSLFQHLHEGLLITDAELRVLDANPAYSQILGVSRAEMLGTVPSLLRPTPADPLARQQRAAMWSALRGQGEWRGELLERRRSGEICTLQVTISSVYGPQGDLRYHVLVITDVTEQRLQRERLERQAHFDELTRLPNRARLSQLLSDAMRSADRDGYLLTVCYLDLDHFKPVNDRHGHAAGDRLLIELAGRLRSALRTRDTWADTAARLGGDEFVLLLRAETLEEARMAVERVLRVVAQPYVVAPDEEPVQVTASMGATVYPIDRSDADTLLRHADHAMYGAKQSGRNGYLFFDPEYRRRTEERVMAIGRVQEALDLGEFVLHYQPKVDMRSGRVLGFEALLRWDHPQHGLIPPAQFLPLIENTGLSSRVGDWVFAQALEHLSQWRRGGLDISVSVNVSARHLQEPDFAQRLSELLARHPEPLASSFELEMLETAAHADIEATSALMGRCRALGVRFALDDFGTGYSTLTYLKRLPVDVLKIDRSFVHHMLDDAQDRAIVEGVIGLARTFGCVVVAEGVESPAQARALLEMGCDIGQGTGIASPMPAGQVGLWARQYKGMFALSPAASPDAAAGGG